MRRRAEALVEIALVSLFVVLFVVMCFSSFCCGYDRGVIDLASGQITAKLVEQPDKTTEWKIEKSKGE